MVTRHRPIPEEQWCGRAHHPLPLGREPPGGPDAVPAEHIRQVPASTLWTANKTRTRLGRNSLNRSNCLTTVRTSLSKAQSCLPLRVKGVHFNLDSAASVA